MSNHAPHELLLPPLPETLNATVEGDVSSFVGTLKRLGDAAGSTPAVREQLVADGVLIRIAQLLTQRSEWLLRTTANDSSSSEHSQGVDVLAQCLRVCGNSCIDCDAARDALLQRSVLPVLLAGLRCAGRVDVLKFAAGALANLICAHEAAQQTFMANDSTAVVVPTLNNAMSARLHTTLRRSHGCALLQVTDSASSPLLCVCSASARIRAGHAHNDDFVLCKLILRLYINLAASTPTTPPQVIHRHHSHILSHPLLPSIVALGRLFVIPVSDQPDPDDHTLLLDIVTLCRAVDPELVVGSEHSELISLVIDASKRQDERLQQLSLSTLCTWSRCSPRVLPFLSSRLHSSFPSLQLIALDVWLRLTNDCEDGEVLEAALEAVPLLVSLAATKRTDVADRAMTVLVNVAAHKEAREQMWRTKGFVKGIRLPLTGQTSPVALVRLLRCLSLSPELAEPMWKEGLVEDPLRLLHSAQQRTHQQRRQVEEKAQIEREVEQEPTQHSSDDIQLQSGLYRYLHNIVSVRVAADGVDNDASNERWERRQWTIMQSSVPESVFVTHRNVARLIIASPAFSYVLNSASTASLTMDTARLLAALIVAICDERSANDNGNDREQQTVTEAQSRLMAAAALVLPQLACLARSDRFEAQHAAARAYRCLLDAHTSLIGIAALNDIRHCLLTELQHSGSVHVVSEVAIALTAFRRQQAPRQWNTSERQLLSDASERWAARLQRQQAEEDVNDPSDEFTILCETRLALQQLLNEGSIDNNAIPVAKTSIQSSACK